MYGTAQTIKLTVEDIAEVCHNVNKAYCQSFNDPSQVSWEDAPEWQKKSAITGVKLHLENPDAGPEESHKSWLAEKLADGWKYGKAKDVEAKTHPCCVPFSHLPVPQQAKDFIFKEVVNSLAKFTK